MCRAVLFSLCLVVSSSSMGQGLIPRLFGLTGRNRIADREQGFRKVKGRKLGAYLASTYPDKKVLLLLPPEMLIPGEGGGELPYVAVLDGLMTGLGKMEVVGKIEPRMPAAVKAKMEKAMAAGGAGMMMAEGWPWFGVNELNKELEPYRGKYDILVCLAPLPGVELPMGGVRGFVSIRELSAMKDKSVSIALCEGGVRRFGPAIRAGKVCAAVSHRMQMKDEDYDRDPPADLDEAFGVRFVLITPGDVARYREYFGE